MITSARLIGLATAISVFILAGGCFFHSKRVTQTADNTTLSADPKATSLPPVQAVNQQIINEQPGGKKIQKDEKSRKKEIKPEAKKSNKPLRPK